MELNFDKLKDIVGFNKYYSEEERYRTSWSATNAATAGQTSRLEILGVWSPGKRWSAEQKSRQVADGKPVVNSSMLFGYPATPPCNNGTAMCRATQKGLPMVPQNCPSSALGCIIWINSCYTLWWLWYICRSFSWAFQISRSYPPQTWKMKRKMNMMYQILWGKMSYINNNHSFILFQCRVDRSIHPLTHDGVGGAPHENQQSRPGVQGWSAGDFFVFFACFAGWL